MPSHRARRTAFTLVELLVVIAIIAVLIGLLIPAIQRVREAGNRSRCTNNLRQIALALHQYHDLRESFPAGYISGVASNGDDTGPGWGWAASILPLVEQGPLFSRIQFDQPIEATINSPARLNVITLYLCPSDTVAATWMTGKHDSAGNLTSQIAEVASANYVGVFGPSEPGVDGEGMFFRNSTISFRDITDGTAQTLLAGERNARLGQATWVGSVTGSTLHAPDVGPQVEDGSSMTLGEANHTPGSPDCEVNEFASLHGPGANFAFADGHISFIATSINRKVYEALSTRAGAEVVEGDY